MQHPALAASPLCAISWESQREEVLSLEREAPSLGVVVRVRCRPRTAPLIPTMRISRATWSRPTPIPDLRAAACNFQAP